MPDRAYTVREIEALREAVDNHYLFGRFSGPVGDNIISRTYMAAEKTQTVEEQVRTYMLAGVTAEDLYASEKE